MSIPTLLVFQDGEPVKRLVGAKGKGQLLAGPRRVHRLSRSAPRASPRRRSAGEQRRGGPGSPAAPQRARARRARRDEAGRFDAGAPTAAVAAFQDARGLRRRRHLRPADLGGAGRERLPPRRPTALPPAADAARRRRRRAAAPAQRARLRRRSRGRHPRRRHRGALGEFQRNVGIATDGICGPDHASPRCAAVGSLAEGSVASVREREALRRGQHRLGGKRVFVAATPGFETLGDAVCRGLAEVGAGALLDTTGADDRTIAAEANRFAADLFLARPPRRRRPGCRCTYFESGTFRSEAGYAWPPRSRRAAGVLPTAPGRAGRRTACCARRAWPPSCASWSSGATWPRCETSSPAPLTSAGRSSRRPPRRRGAARQLARCARDVPVSARIAPAAGVGDVEAVLAEGTRPPMPSCSAASAMSG